MFRYNVLGSILNLLQPTTLLSASDDPPPAGRYEPFFISLVRRVVECNDLEIKIIPLTKPGKEDDTMAKAWRPILLLATLGKVLETVIESGSPTQWRSLASFLLITWMCASSV